MRGIILMATHQNGKMMNCFKNVGEGLRALPELQKELGGHGNPPLQNIIRDLKSFTTHKFGEILWQRSYYDHIVRGEQDYREIWQYIDHNPFQTDEEH